MNANKLIKSDYIFLFIVLIGFYFIYRFSLFISDDYYYSFIGGMSGGINGKYIPVDSFADALRSNIYDYMNWNGRFIIHTITSYFCGVLGVDVFRIFNSIVFTLLIAGLIKLIRSEFGYNSTDKYIILFLLFILMPKQGSIFLGHIAMVTNYLWTSCAIVYFIILYNKIKDAKKYNAKINTLLLLTGIVVGSLQESFTIGVSAALFFYYCFNTKKFRGSVVWLVMGFFIGTCIVTLAPGNFIRFVSSAASNNSLSGLIKYVSQFAHLIIDSKLLFICIILFIALYLKNKIFILDFINKNMFYIIAILFNGIIVTIVYTDKRQLTCIELFSMILLIKLIYIYFYNFCKNKNIIIKSIISVFLILLYIPIYKDRKICYEKFAELQEMIPENGIIIDKNIIDNTKYIRNHTMIYNYVFYLPTSLNLDFYRVGLSLLKSQGIDENYITAILPTSQEEIAGFFKDNMSRYVYDKVNKVYYFRCPKNKYIKDICMYSKPNVLLGKIRNHILNTNYNKTYIAEQLATFQYSDYNYYVFIDNNGLEVIDFEIEYK